MGSIVSVQMDGQPGEIPRYLIIDRDSSPAEALRRHGDRDNLSELPQSVSEHGSVHHQDHQERPRPIL
jgi:hypothetical protein